MTAPRRRSRREWARLADNAELVHLAGQIEPDERGGIVGLFITAGPRHYVRRVHERLARENGYILTSVRRQPVGLVNPLSGEPNHCYEIRLERRQ